MKTLSQSYKRKERIWYELFVYPRHLEASSMFSNILSDEQHLNQLLCFPVHSFVCMYNHRIWSFGQVVIGFEKGCEKTEKPKPIKLFKRLVHTSRVSHWMSRRRRVGRGHRTRGSFTFETLHNLLWEDKLEIEYIWKTKKKHYQRIKKWKR